MNKEIGDPTGSQLADEVHQLADEGREGRTDFQKRAGLPVDLFTVSGELSDAMKSEFRAAEAKLKKSRDAAWKDFAEAVEEDHKKAEAREAAFWAKHEYIAAENLADGMTIVERGKGKPRRAKIRNITVFGSRDNYRRVEVYGIQTLWSYHVSDRVLVQK